jgi:putative SOS response-associated peptidase YedK
MCGRARLSSDVSEIKLVFRIPPERPTPNFPPSWNVAPTDSLPVVRYDLKAGQRSLDMLRWGLIPYWAKDINVGFANINAKAEGIENKPAFRKAFERRRCLVPVDNFYEWKKTGTGKQPYAIALADRGIMALAGLWENWHSPAGEWVRSFANRRSAVAPRMAPYNPDRWVAGNCLADPPRGSIGPTRTRPRKP